MKQNTYKIYNSDCIKILKTLPENSIDSLITDPPAGIGLLGLDWDKDKGGKDEWIKWLTSIMIEVKRVLKPGAFGFVWAIPRTSHWTACALEDSGFLVKDIITHVFGSGFPKSQSIEKMILKSKTLDNSRVYKVTKWIRSKKRELGLTNKRLDEILHTKGATAHYTAIPGNSQAQIPTKKNWEILKSLFGEAPWYIEKIVRNHHTKFKNTQVSDELLKLSGKWKGFGTSLKPASEHWILVQKPLEEKTIAKNIIKYQTGALNIDGSRIKTTDDIKDRLRSKSSTSYSPFFGTQTKELNKVDLYTPHEMGRFPTNFVATKGNTSFCPLDKLDEQKGKKVSHFFKSFKATDDKFFYSSKPTKNEKGDFNDHPTVKPLNLMRYLIKMITPAKGTVLDPFMGSGTTGVSALFEGFSFIGIEKEEAYFKICSRRLLGVERLKNAS